MILTQECIGSIEDGVIAINRLRDKNCETCGKKMFGTYKHKIGAYHYCFYCR